MRTVEKKYTLGIVTDEQAMFDILEKFLTKEGYEVKRVLHEISDEDDFALVIQAPTRPSDRSVRFSKSLKSKKFLVVQACDEDYSDTDNNAIVLSQRPLNLRQLSETIKSALTRSNRVEAVD